MLPGKTGQFGAQYKVDSSKNLSVLWEPQNPSSRRGTPLRATYSINFLSNITDTKETLKHYLQRRLLQVLN